MTPKEFKIMRIQLNINSQEKMAQMLGCSLNTVWNYENGKTPIPLLVEKYLKMLNNLKKK